MNKALFLDRDGVINEDYGYVHKIEDFHFRNGIFDVCLAARKARLKIVVVTNQAGIGRGLYSTDQFALLNNYMVSTFSTKGIIIDRVYYCPFHPTHGLGHYRKYSCDRKPGAGMLVAACNELNINPFASILIGDKDSDRLAAERIGLKLFLNSSEKNWVEHSLTAIHMLT